MTYSEYLKSLGATEDEIKLMDTGVARKAFDKLQADLTAASDRVAAAEQSKKDYEAKSTEWHDRVNTEYLTVKDQLVVAKANEAKARAVIDEAQKQGLIKVAEDLGYVTAPPKPDDKSGTPNFDPTKYFTKDDIVGIARKEAQAIAIAQDIASEHRMLFPDKPLKFAALRDKADTSGKSVQEVWEQEFGVPAARAAKEAADKTAYEKRLRDEGAATARAELASQYGNPDTRPLSTSTSPFAPRPAANREKQPWEAGLDGDNGSNDRVARATKSFIERQARPN
jgi:hypothetical protein